MTTRRGKERPGDFECIDPVLGALLPLDAAGVLDGDDAERVAAHVEACAACAENARAMRALESMRPEELEGTRLAPLARRRSLLPSPASLVAAASVVVAFAFLVAWQRARDVVLVSEVRLLRAEVARLEARSEALLAALEGGGAGRRVVPVAGVRFAQPPNF